MKEVLLWLSVVAVLAFAVVALYVTGLAAAGVCVQCG